MTSGRTERAQDEVARIASDSGTLAAVSAIHLESGERIELHAEEPLPLASTYKLPIAIKLLKLVEEGRLSLQQMIDVREEDLTPGSGLIKDFFTIPGLRLSVQNLLGLTFQFSDNTTSDIVLNLAGEGAEVTRMLRASGIEGIRIDRSAKQILCDFYRLSELASRRPWSLKDFQARLRETSAESREAGLDEFLHDPRDRGTASAVTSLLTMFFRGELLNPLHTNLLMDLMRRCQTGPKRLKGQLPAGTVVAHKTGTLEGAIANDAGIVELPDGQGHIAIAAFVQSTQRKTPELETVIAQVGKTVYDCWTGK